MRNIKKGTITTKKICILGLCVALFVTLSLCLRVSVFENYYLCLGYIVMYIALHMFGVVEGTFVGVIGTLLYCILISGLRGMPGWIAGNVLIGIILGLWLGWIKRLVAMKYTVVVDLCTALIILLATAVGILLVKSVVEVLLYGELFLIRIGNNIYAFVADVVVLVLSIPICRIIEPRLKKLV